ncbi:ubiquitin-conjugating enzyme domain-containing protein [Plasmodium vivax Brazil I]|uniref:Ubiquitin-conjugating enzyme domain-containing protein n=1 Tax=Plasmodium vivax (strain Brazil I) TaxID=1033975 RepID=A0A0J9VE28_PLAV1|nr:ubiquitin-conjugating enzyme domain-containing protein [Plasmodium vivax Brazil I]
MWYDNERVPEEEGVSKLLVGKTFAYFPKCPDDEGRHVQGEGRYGGVGKEGHLPHRGNANKADNMETMDSVNRAGKGGVMDTMEDVGDSHRGDDPMSETNGDGGHPADELDSMHHVDGLDSVLFNQKEYVLIQQRLGRTIIPLNPELLAQSTLEQEIIDGYLSEIHKNVRKCSILTEYSFLVQQMPRGIYCLPQKDNLLVWDVFIILYSTVYRNAKFKAQIRLGENYPHSIPEVFFLSPVFHPFINLQTGKLNLGKHLNEWTPKSHYMSLIFLYMRNIFYLQDEYNKENVENEEAYFLLNNDRELFLRKVHECVQMSNERLYQQVDNCMFNFGAELASREIADMMQQVKDDPLCSRKAEAFIHWLINDYAAGASEGVISEAVISEEVISEEVISEEVISEEVKSENSPIEELISEEVRSEEVRSEEAISEDPPSEEVISEDPSSEAKRNEDTPSEEVRSEEPPSEKAITEEVISEEVISEDTPSEEVRSEDPPSEEVRSEDPPSEEVLSEDPPSEKAISEDPPSKEVISEDPPSEEVISEDPPSEDPTSEEVTGEKVTGEKVTNEEVPGEGVPGEDPPRDGTEEGGAPPNEVTPHYDNGKRENEHDGATPVDATAVQHLRRDRRKRSPMQ